MRANERLRICKSLATDSKVRKKQFLSPSTLFLSGFLLLRRQINGSRDGGDRKRRKETMRKTGKKFRPKTLTIWENEGRTQDRTGLKKLATYELYYLCPKILIRPLDSLRESQDVFCVLLVNRVV